jgi:broad specificity phosphatase PhoE
MTTKIILVRHGQTAWNPQGRPRGRAAVPLDHLGVLQAKAAARYIADHWTPNAIYYSPLRRTDQTASEIAALIGVPTTPHAGLLDVDFGAWEGRRPDDLASNWAEAWQNWLSHPQDVVIPGGETLRTAQFRALDALRSICLGHLGETVVVVSHTAINRLLILGVLGISLEHFRHLGQEMTAINVLDFDGQNYILRQMNLTEHLANLPR